MIAVFARPNHPRYTNEREGKMVESGEWRYHGYVVVFVSCSTHEQVLEVRAKLAKDGLPEPYEGHAGYEQGWYGGRMDLLTVLHGPGIYADTDWYECPIREGREQASIGDNRFAGFYEASELLS